MEDDIGKSVEMTTIRDAAELCLNSFDHFLSKACTDSDPTTFAAVRDQYQRFKIWSSNIGVFAELRASLDFRVREYDDIKEIFLGHLQIIDSRLGELNNLSNAQSSVGSPDPDVELDAGSSDSKSSGSQSDCSAGFQSWTAPELIQSTSDNIDWLHKMSNLIRKASFLNQNKKANAHKLEDELGNDMTQQLTQYFDFLVKREFQGIPDDSRLPQRLVTSMLLRRKQIAYRQSRQERWDLRQEAYIKRRKPSQSLEGSSALGPEPIAVESLAQQVVESYSPIHRSSGKSGVTSTTLDGNLYHKLAAPSRISQGRSSPLNVKSRLLVPPPPKSAAGSRNFVCEYCCLVLDGELAQKRNREQWIDHVKRDSYPYVCVFDDCDDPLELFPTQHEWLVHMQNRHLAQWHCAHTSHPSPNVFESEERFKTHMKEVHAGRFDEDQLSVVAESSTHPKTPAFEVCPLCSDCPDRLEDHIASHLHNLALISLPWSKDESEGSVYDSTSEADGSQSGARSTVRDFRSEGSSDDLYLNEHIEHEDVPDVRDAEPGRAVSYVWMPKIIDQHKPITRSEQLQDDILATLGSTAADADEARLNLQEDLAEGLAAGFPEQRSYVPESCLQERVTRATIKRCLPGAKEELLNFVSNSAQKIFAILLYSGCLPRGVDIEAVLQTCKDRHLTDAELPFPRKDERCDCIEDRALCRHKVALDILRKWRAYGWEQFYNNQWQFLGHVFEDGVFDYVLHEKSILPIMLRDGHGEGSFGDVREGELNQSHARRSERSIEPRLVAIKTFKDVYENGYQGLAARRAWKMEAKNLSELSERNHPHLIHRVATVTHGERFLILSDWANGGDLNKFWEQEPKPAVSSALVLEVVKQLRGLSSAIELIHHGYYAGDLSRNAIRADQQVDRRIGAAAEDFEKWRLGDLKPDKILRFLDSGELVGTLKISDLGLTKRHIRSTNLPTKTTMYPPGTPAYEPPEATTMLLPPRSRFYDIWSFGCIMLEFVIWLLYGHEGLQDFWTIPIERDETRFWTKLPPGVEPGAVVNRSVTQIMDQILATNAACQPPSAIRDLLLLIRDRVLVPALPDLHSAIPPEQRRIHADLLLKALEDIENKCRSPAYSCPDQPQRDARLPTAWQSMLR